MGAAPKIDVQKLIDEKSSARSLTLIQNRPAPQPLIADLGPFRGSFSNLLAAASSGVLADAIMQVTETTRIDDDFAGWLVDQASALRERRTFSLDWDNLAEELEDKYAQLEKDLESDLRIVLEHLLKLQFEPSENEWKGRSRKWKVDTIEHRARIDTILKKSPKLRQRTAEFVTTQYPVAIRKVATQTGRRRASFPLIYPWSVNQILDPDFFPNPFNLPDDEE
jgi:hypothetical protein